MPFNTLILKNLSINTSCSLFPTKYLTPHKTSGSWNIVSAQLLPTEGVDEVSAQSLPTEGVDEVHSHSVSTEGVDEVSVQSLPTEGVDE